MDIREYLASLGRLRWEKMTPAQREAHIRRMVAGQRKARLAKRAKARTSK